MQFNETYIAAMYLMFLRAPRQERPDLDGHYWLGEIGAAREKDWSRLTPYSPAQKEAPNGSLQLRIPQLPWA